MYEHGTERTAQNAAAYRLGMTMTEWACRSLLSLGQTHHLELGGPIPALSNTFKDPKRTLPDLWGRHEAEEMYWLIEAKGGSVGVGTLRKGWAQLEAGSKILGSYKHRIVLVGASVRPGDDLFLTIDHDLHSGEPPLPRPDPALTMQRSAPATSKTTSGTATTRSSARPVPRCSLTWRCALLPPLSCAQCRCRPTALPATGVPG